MIHDNPVYSTTFRTNRLDLPGDPMRSCPASTARTAVLTTALLGGFLTAAPAGAAPADSAAPNCTVRTQKLDVAVNRERRTATTTASWDISCRRATNITAELRVSSPHRVQQPMKMSYGKRFIGGFSAAGSVDPDEPMHTAVLTFREGDEIIGTQLRKCAKKPDGTESCYQGATVSAEDVSAAILSSILGFFR
jgi:hypothetical protein